MKSQPAPSQKQQQPNINQAHSPHSTRFPKPSTINKNWEVNPNPLNVADMKHTSFPPENPHLHHNLPVYSVVDVYGDDDISAHANKQKSQHHQIINYA